MSVCMCNTYIHTCVCIYIFFIMFTKMAAIMYNVSLACTASANKIVSTKTTPHDVALFVVKFDYNPFEMSPNPNPHQELTLTAGRYIYIYGNMDEVKSQCILLRINFPINCD